MQRALTNITGVTKADVSLKTAEVVVTLDDAQTNIEELAKAVRQAGFRSRIKEVPR